MAGKHHTLTRSAFALSGERLDMSSTYLPVTSASSNTAQKLATCVPVASTAGGSSHVLSEMVNDAVVATSSVLLIGSFFWVSVRRCWMLQDCVGARGNRRCVVLSVSTVSLNPVSPHLGPMLRCREMVRDQSRERREERAFLQCCMALRFVDLSTTPTWHVTQPARSDELREIARDPPLVA